MASNPVLAAPARASRRWYAHGWNRPLSWELILRITPRLPRWLLVPLHHATTLVCFALMPRERSAARRNLCRVTGARGLANWRLAYRLFYNFSRFMVAYTEVRSFEMERFRSRLTGAVEVETAIRQAVAAGRGAIVVTMHVGQWDLGLKMMLTLDVPVHVVMLSEDARAVTRYADEARAMPNLRVHQTGSTPLLAVELMAALQRGEIVAVQIDRPAGSATMRVDLFGAPVALPAGPAQLAMATGAPLVPVFVLFDRGDRYRLITLPPLVLPRPARGTAEEALAEAMKRIASMVEQVASRYPDQWFNFYDVWERDA